MREFAILENGDTYDLTDDQGQQIDPERLVEKLDQGFFIVRGEWYGPEEFTATTEKPERPSHRRPRLGKERRTAFDCCPELKAEVAQLKAAIISLESQVADLTSGITPATPPKKISLIEQIKADPTLHAVTVAPKTTVTSAKELAAEAEVEKIPRSGETYILWLAINRVIGPEVHAARIAAYWKSFGENRTNLITRIKRDCSGGMAYELAAHYGVEHSSSKSESRNAPLLAEHLLR